MSQRAIHVVADNWFAQLNTTVNNSITSWVLKSSGATGLPTPSALERTILHCGAEKVLVTAVTVDTPSAGLDTLTVTRGYGGSTASTHAADDYVGHFYYREHHNDLARRLAMLEYFLYSRVGAANGVIQDGGLQVAAAGTPSMTIHISAGSAMVAGQPAALRAATTLVFVAPVGNPRIDIVQIDQEGNIEAKTGTPAGSPVAPTVDADAEKLAEVYITTAATSIKNTNDATNGYITQAQVYL